MVTPPRTFILRRDVSVGRGGSQRCALFSGTTQVPCDSTTRCRSPFLLHKVTTDERSVGLATRWPAHFRSSACRVTPAERPFHCSFLHCTWRLARVYRSSRHPRQDGAITWHGIFFHPERRFLLPLPDGRTSAEKVRPLALEPRRRFSKHRACRTRMNWDWPMRCHPMWFK